MDSSLKVRRLERLEPWPAGIFGDFGEAVDKVLDAEDEEESWDYDGGTWTWSERAELWHRRHRTRRLGEAALKLQQEIRRRILEVELQMRRSGKRNTELKELVAIEVEVSPLEMRELADPWVWGADGSLVKDVGPIRAGWFLLGAIDLHSKGRHRLRGRALEIALEDIQDMSAWYIPTEVAVFSRPLAFGVPILDAWLLAFGDQPTFFFLLGVLLVQSRKLRLCWDLRIYWLFWQGMCIMVQLSIL